MKKALLSFAVLLSVVQFSSASFDAKCITITRDLTLKSSDYGTNEDVSNLQYFLNQGKYLIYYPDGKFGTTTQVALKEFQKDYKISPTGYAGPVTRAKIKSLSCKPDVTLLNNNYYTNTKGNKVHSPSYTSDNSIPAGASARCGDGTYSFSQSRRGTCSRHGGVSSWLR